MSAKVTGRRMSTFARKSGGSKRNLLNKEEKPKTEQAEEINSEDSPVEQTQVKTEFEVNEQKGEIVLNSLKIKISGSATFELALKFS